MPATSITPYLILNGHAEKVLAFYETALEAKVVDLRRFGDGHPSCPEAMRQNVMHAELALGSTRIMLSDGPSTGTLPPTGLVSIAVGYDDRATTDRHFAALANGGRVIEALFESPWGSYFGVVADRFGVHWMFDCTEKKS